jgi:hypothetical protein
MDEDSSEAPGDAMTTLPSVSDRTTWLAGASSWKNEAVPGLVRRATMPASGEMLGMALFSAPEASIKHTLEAAAAWRGDAIERDKTASVWSLRLQFMVKMEVVMGGSEVREESDEG